MAVNKWCSTCGIKWEYCQAPGSHKSNLKYRAIVKPGGRSGRQISKTFLLSSEAHKWEREQLVKAERTGGQETQLMFSTFCDLYYDQYCVPRGKRLERKIISRLKQHIDNRPIKDVSIRDIEFWIQKRVNSNLKPGS